MLKFEKIFRGVLKTGGKVGNRQMPKTIGGQDFRGVDGIFFPNQEIDIRQGPEAGVRINPGRDQGAALEQKVWDFLLGEDLINAFEFVEKKGVLSDRGIIKPRASFPFLCGEQVQEPMLFQPVINQGGHPLVGTDFPEIIPIGMGGYFSQDIRLRILQAG